MCTILWLTLLSMSVSVSRFCLMVSLAKWSLAIRSLPNLCSPLNTSLRASISTCNDQNHSLTLPWNLNLICHKTPTQKNLISASLDEIIVIHSCLVQTKNGLPVYLLLIYESSILTHINYCVVSLWKKKKSVQTRDLNRRGRPLGRWQDY